VRRAQWWAVFAIGAFAVVGCSGDSDGGAVATEPPVTICSATGAPQAEADLPAVSSVRTAISDLEQQLGGPQEFFEVNATARLVNLFVALNGGTLAQAWVWVDGELSSVEPQAASGGTFTGADVVFDPDTVLSAMRGEIPDATLESFYVHGDGAGNVQYGVLATARCGGGLDVIVGADGAVKSVDPVN
jgi:hypothetical protein